MTWTFKNTDTRWGAGTGSGVDGKLTSLQGDENTYEAKIRIEALEGQEAVSVSSITYTGSTITFNMSDSTTHGPFPLPVAMINPVGEWQADTHYNYLDLVNVRAQGIFLVLIEHTTATDFDANATDGSTDNSPIYQLWAPNPAREYDIAISYKGEPPGDSSIIAQILAPHSYTLLSGIEDAFAYLGTAAQNQTLVFSIEQNGSEIGTITFEPGVGAETDGGQFGVIEFPNDTDFVPGDRLVIRAPAVSDVPTTDGFPVASDLSVSIPATRTD